MELITKEILEAFEKQGYTGDKEVKDIRIVVKLFNPTGVGTWYLYEREDDDIYWGFVNLGDPEMSECGTVSLNELKEFKGMFGLGIERDLYFEPLSKSLAEVIEIVKRGGCV